MIIYKIQISNMIFKYSIILLLLAGVLAEKTLTLA